MLTWQRPTESTYPTDRWQAASGRFHSRFDQFLQTDLVALSQRNITEGLGMLAGNGFYGATQGILNFSLTLSPMDLLGAQADHVAYLIGNALFNISGIVVGAVVLVVVGFVFQMLRTGARPWKKIATSVGLVALFVIMLTGAQASTTTNGSFSPGLGSPGWFATKINSSITTLATAPATALTLADPAALSSVPKAAGCAPYMANLSAAYTKGYGGGDLGSGAIPQIISSMWSNTGLSVWKQTQYGSTPINASGTTGETYGDSIFCHQLDWQAGISAKDQAITTFGSQALADQARAVTKSLAWGAPGDSDMEDRSMIAWAACVNNGSGSFTVRSAFATKHGDGLSGTWIDATMCQKWWNGDDKSLSSFNIGGKASDVTGFYTDDQGVVDFVQTLHGTQTNAGVILVVTYNISAFLLLIVFGGLGIAVIFAKFAGVLMLFAVFFVLITSIASKQDMGSKLVGFLKTYIGFSVFAFGATFVLALITTLSSMISSTGVSVFESGSIMSLIWTGLAPIVAVVILHLIFTKIFKVPSVFKPSSALAWGSAGGAVGGVLGSAMLNRAESRAQNTARGIGQRAKGIAGNYAKGKISVGGRGPGGRTDRKGMMSPSGAASVGATAVSTAGAAAAAGGKLSNHQVRAQKFDKQLLKDAKLFSRGGDPLATAGSRAKTVTAKLPRTPRPEPLTGEAREAHRLGRAATRAANTVAFREKVRALPSAAKNQARDGITKAREAMVVAGKQAADNTRFAVQNPSVAGSILAERTGNAFVKAAGSTARYTAAGTRSAVRGATTFVKAADSPANRAIVRSAGKVALGAVVGGLIAGPAGAVAGVGVGVGRVRHTIHTHTSREDARKVDAWAAHLKSKEESDSPKVAPRETP
jgi:hypothetical protein